MKVNFHFNKFSAEKEVSATCMCITKMWQWSVLQKIFLSLEGLLHNTGLIYSPFHVTTISLAINHLRKTYLIWFSMKTLSTVTGLKIKIIKRTALKITGWVWAILGHYSRTIQNSVHDSCLKVPKSGSSYNWDATLGTAYYKPPTVWFIKVIRPVSNCLTNPSFL